MILKNHPYFPAVDGLRAIAVIAVLLFHVGAIIPAGFIGVDVFFVISGFVVASAAVSLPVDSFFVFLRAFYARRILRIVPALAVVVIVSFLIDALIVPDAWLSNANTKSGLAALFGLSNIFFALSSSDYWSPRIEFNPFTHTWSLGVEEQFYLIFPLLFFGWMTGRRRPVTFILVGLTVVSLLALYAVQEHYSRTMAFYSLPTRFWELGLGVLLFMTNGVWKPWFLTMRKSNIEAIGIVAFIAMVGSLLWIDESHFPWPSGLVPVLSTLLLIMVSTTREDGVIVRFLSMPATVFVGKLSYSIYLWHWPVIVFMKWTSGLADWPHQLAACFISFLLAWASWRYIENPVRYSQKLKSVQKGRVVLLGAGTMGLCAVLAVLVVISKPVISMSVTSDESVWYPDAVLQLASVDRTCAVEDGKERFDSGRRFEFNPVDCPTANVPRVFVAGDSHAWAYSSMLRSYAAATGSRVSVFTAPGCSVFNMRNSSTDLGPACGKFVASLFSALNKEAKPGDILFLPSLRLPRFGDQWGDTKVGTAASIDRQASIDEAVARLGALSSRGVRVFFEAPKPIFRVPLFRCSDSFNKDNPDCQGGLEVSRKELDNLRAPVLSAMKQVKDQVPSVVIWDPYFLLCPNDACSPVLAGKPLFFDGDHLTAFGNSVVAESFLNALVAH
jgi:peptidoglycan/LPS O-acetylase OafA/YrhL